MDLRRALPGPDARQGLVSLILDATTSLLAGAILGSLTATFEAHPGLLVLVPAAVGLRGNVFGSLGNRVSTAIHTGDFQLRMRRGTLLGQNVLASAVLTLGVSLALVPVVLLVSVGLGLGPTIGLADLTLLSVGGGVLASIPVLAATLGLAAGSVRFGWDLDNVNAPLVSVLGDVITLPALWIGTFALGAGMVTTSVGWGLAAGAIAATVLGFRSQLPLLRRIVRESFPVLIAAALLSALAGVVVEQRLTTFRELPALLILVPAHLGMAGSLGGVLSGRLSSQLHLGTAPPSVVPSRAARRDIGLVAGLSLPVFLFNGLGTAVAAALMGVGSPGLGYLVGAAVLAGALTMVAVLGIAYYGAIVAVRTGIDPDTYGIPLVTAVVDLVGAVTLIVAIAALGLV